MLKEQSKLCSGSSLQCVQCVQRAVDIVFREQSSVCAGPVFSVFRDQSSMCTESSLQCVQGAVVSVLRKQSSVQCVQGAVFNLCSMFREQCTVHAGISLQCVQGAVYSVCSMFRMFT